MCSYFQYHLKIGIEEILTVVKVHLKFRSVLIVVKGNKRNFNFLKRENPRGGYCTNGLNHREREKSKIEIEIKL